MDRIQKKSNSKINIIKTKSTPFKKIISSDKIIDLISIDIEGNELDVINSIDLDQVGQTIISAGYIVGIQNRLCWTFTGPCDLTLYPSGKLLVKTEDKTLAAEVAKLHVESWTANS